MSRRQRFVRAAFALLLGVPAGSLAGSEVGGAPPALAVAFVSVDSEPGAGEALLDVGPLFAPHPGAKGGGVTVRRWVGVRVTSPAGTVAVARLQAFLASEVPGCTVRVDGVPLSAIPRVLDPVFRVGTTAVHQVEIEVPPNVPPGPFASAITWLAEAP